MSKQNSSPNVDRVVRLSQTQIDRAARVVRSDDRGSGRLKTACVTWPDLPEYSSRPVVPVAEADHPAVDFWWTALAFVVEGFAVYGASLHPTLPVHELLADAKVHRQRPAGGQQSATAYANGGSQPSENSDVVELTRATWTDARPARHWNWLTSLGETVATLWTRWRRERQIKRGIAALAQYDDRSLLDLGICGRSDIERVVRYGRDC
jgi:uncharacterized protein YjiS (DUF1127 family)